MKIKTVEKYGFVCKENEGMDKLRKTECLCFNCQLMGDCDVGKKLYDICVENGTALMVTRCKDFLLKYSKDKEEKQCQV